MGLSGRGSQDLVYRSSIQKEGSNLERREAVQKYVKIRECSFPRGNEI